MKKYLLKTFLTVSILTVFTEQLIAQAPQGFNYQAVIRNNVGAVVVNTAVSIRMNVIQGSSTGTISYSEKHNVTTNSNGSVNVVIGQGTALSGTFASINWANGPYFIETAYDVNNPGTFTVLGTQQLMSVPYALYAGNGLPTNGSNGQQLTYCNGVAQWGPCPLQQNAQIVTSGISFVTSYTATVSASILATPGDSLLASGICWATSSNPNIQNSHTTNNVTNGNFSTLISNLLPATTYHVRAYATKNQVTIYGNELSFTTSEGSSLAIGQAYQGGIIAYILQPGDPGYDPANVKGFIAAPYDQSSAAKWGCYGVSIEGADGSIIGSGYQNTIDIVNGCSTAGIAARICYDLILNGYDDWYLPSHDELWKLLINRFFIGGFVEGLSYWSSSEANVTGSRYYTFYNGPTHNFGVFSKDYDMGVRAIRSFSTPVSTLVVPTLSTASAYNITASTAILGGSISNNGGSSISARGVCWSTKLTLRLAKPSEYQLMARG